MLGPMTSLPMLLTIIVLFKIVLNEICDSCAPSKIRAMAIKELAS